MHHIYELLIKNLIFDHKAASVTSQSLPRMGNTLSMSHPGQSLNRGHIYSLLIKNLVGSGFREDREDGDYGDDGDDGDDGDY